MKKMILAIAIGTFLLGVILFAVNMTALGWDFSKLTNGNYQTVEKSVSEDFHHISIITDTADVLILPSEDDKVKVVSYTQEKIHHNVTVSENTLKIYYEDERAWYEHIAINSDAAKISVYLPKDTYGAISIQTDTGKVELDEAFTFESITVNGETGWTKIFASALGEIKVSLSTGGVQIEKIKANALDLSVSTGKIILSQVECTEEIKTATTTGDTKFVGVTCKNLTSTGDTGDLEMIDVLVSQKLYAKRSTGDIELERCDAAELDLQTSTGDVEGSLRSEKIFFAETDTGEKDVPKTLTGGRCEIRTSTGDIEIVIQN